MILNNHAVVNQFVGAYKNKFAFEQLISKTKRALDISVCFEDMAFIATSVKEISPSEKALILINSNLAVAGTDEDCDELITQHFSVESLRTSSENSLGQAANQLSEIWEKVDSLVSCLKAINVSLLHETNKLTEIVQKAKLASNLKVSTDPQSFVLQNLPDALKLVSYSESDYLKSLEQVVKHCKGRVTNSSAKAISSLTGLIDNGLAELSSSTLREAENTSQSQIKKVNQVLTISTENQVGVSEDGLIIGLDSELTEEDAERLLEDQATAIESLTESSKLAPQVVIDENILNSLTTCLQNNAELIALCIQSCDLIVQEGMVGKVDGFGQSVQNLLINPSSNSRIRVVIKSYCDTFIDIANLSNQEIFFMLCVSRYLTSYNELIRDIVQEVSPESL